tara:strand:- start:419 stop:1354 length:936 start_codon:yes stop_codon:yes gene_type:complete
MNCAQFLASDATQDRAQVLAFLKAHLPAEEMAAYDNDAIPVSALVAILKGKSEQIDAALAETKRKEEADGAWDKLLAEAVEGDGAENLRKRAKKIGAKSQLKVLPGDEGAILKITNPHLIQVALRAMRDEKKRVLAEALEATAPKSKKKVSGGVRRTKKADADYEIEYLNEKSEAQGADYAHYLKRGDITDEKALIAKDQKISKCGKKKSKRWKAVRKEKAFMPAEPTDCCRAAITWDRAGGSLVLKDAGIAGSFRMCCSEKAEDGSHYCSKHAKKKAALGAKFEDFWEGEYKTGDLKGTKWSEFLCEACA